ncbi:DnaJ domain-containing protein [Hirsutella rhossiliensis]
MGAQQSLPGQDANATVARTCYYVLLDVEHDATEHEIKKAYHKRALELHPDRNINDVETATKKFAEVQAAYDVLSDPQERAWYDSHRDAILSGHDGSGHGAEPATFRNVRLTTTEEILSLVRKFNATVPFNDQPSGFFGMAREVFEHLALEEEAAAEAANLDCPEYPTFGFAGDDYDGVVKPFYAAWAGFSTKKYFSWKDKYRPSDAPDRRTRRLMEKENKKSRDDAIREFNDAVGFLVVFVRKRDPRYLPNAQTNAERQKSLRDVVAAQAARSRAANREKMASCSVPDWTGFGADETQECFYSESDEESEIELLECVVCNKSFKSANQLKAHDRSKKHTKAVQELRRQLRKEGAELDLDTAPLPASDIDQPPRTVPPELAAAPQEAERESTEAAELDTAMDGQASSSPQGSTSALGYDEYAPRSMVEQRLDSAQVAGDDDSRNLGASPQDGQSQGQAREKKGSGREVTRGRHRESFESRTRLFKHIREEGHAAPASKTATRDEKAMKKRR